MAERGATRGDTLSPLLERDGELDALSGAVGAAIDGSGSLVYLEGHAGIGKTSLLAAACAHAAGAGAIVLTARGSELERAHSFGVAVQLFETTLHDAQRDERTDLLSGAAGLASPLFDGAPAVTSGAPEEQLFQLLHGLYWLTSNLAERAPVVLAVDDGHWTDPGSLRFLLYLAQRLPELPVAVFVTARPAEPGAPAELLRSLKAAAATRVLRPAPLSPAAVASLVTRRLASPDEAFVAACARATEGNPYLLAELLTDLRRRGLAPTAAAADQLERLAPDAVLHAAVDRLSRLPEGSVELARAVAVLGAHAGLHGAAVLAGLDRGAAGEALDALVAAGLLTPGPPVAFVHPLIRTGTYQDIPVAERGELHAAAARLLADAGAAEETVAAQLLAATASGDPWVVERLRSAARHSAAQGATASAIRYLGRALDEPPAPHDRAEVLLELGRAESVAGVAGAIARLEQAGELIDDPARCAEALHELGWARQKSGDLRGAVAAFERGLAELDRAADGVTRPDLARMRTAHLGAALLEPSSSAEAQRALREMRSTGPGDGSEHELLAVLATQLLFGGEAIDDMIALSLQVWDDGRLLESRGTDSAGIWHVIGCLAWADALDEAERILEATLERARRQGSIVTLALGFYARAWPRFWRGDLAGSAADSQAAISAWSGEFSMYLPVAAFWHSLAQVELGDLDSAAAALELPEAEERWGRSNMYGAWLAGRGRVALAGNRAPEAVGLFEQAGGSVLGAMVANPAVIPWRSWLAEARVAAGDVTGARAAAAEEVELARRFGAARPLGIALRAQGLAEGGPTGVARLEEAVAVLRRSPSTLELARALVDLGGAIRRSGRPAEAREPLREALELADRFGAVRLGRQARDELLAAGARPRRRELSGPESLTPSELRVAKLAASGLTNREIAQALFVTVKAVQFHLGNTYRKLALTGRDQLPAALGE